VTSVLFVYYIHHCLYVIRVCIMWYESLINVVSYYVIIIALIVLHTCAFICNNRKFCGEDVVAESPFPRPEVQIMF